MLADTRELAHQLRAVYRASAGDEGLVEFGCTPDVAWDPRAIVNLGKQARHETHAPNVVIGVPSTDAGLTALEELTYRGLSTTVDGVFCVQRYAEVAEAYIGGLERRVLEGLPVDRIVSVAWLPLTALDRWVDALLGPASPLRGAVAVAAAQAIYLESNRRFSGRRWRRLVARGARPQTAGFRDIGAAGSRVETLALPGSALALSPEDAEASRGKGPLEPSEPDETEAAWILREAAAAGAPLPALAPRLRRTMHQQSAFAYRAVLALLAGHLRGTEAHGGGRIEACS